MKKAILFLMVLALTAGCTTPGQPKLKDRPIKFPRFERE